MKKLLVAIITIISFNLTQSIFCQINPDSVEIIVEEIKPGINLISLYGGNLLLSHGPDGLFLVDASYVELAEKLKAEIQKIDPRPVKYLVNTHWHFDHVGANALLGKDATIIAQEYTANLLTHDQELMGVKYPALPQEGQPDITFGKELMMYFNSDTIQLLTVPGGHSGGDILVYFKHAKVLHVGDMVFSDMFPFCDIAHKGNAIRMAKIVQFIIRRYPADTKIVTGHGRILSMQDLIKYKEMIILTSNLVRTQMKMHKTLEQIKESDVLKDWKQYSVFVSANDWIDLIYKSVRR